MFMLNIILMIGLIEDGIGIMVNLLVFINCGKLVNLIIFILEKWNFRLINKDGMLLMF